MEQSERAVDIQSVIDEHKFSRYQWMVFVLCFMVVGADGFDTVAIGLIAPTLRNEWGVTVSDLSPVLAAALAGLGIGALIAGPLADRFGRKRILVASVFFFGLWSLATAFSWSITSITVLRFLTGLGLGAAMPNALTMMSEYAPARSRALAVNAVFAGFSVALALGGLLAAYLIPHFGWQSILVVGGVGPCILAVALIIWLPESIQYLAVRGNKDHKIAEILGRIAKSRSFDGCRFIDSRQVYVGENRQQKRGLSLAVSEDFRFYTIMLWVTYFMAMLVYYLLTSWLPTLFDGIGFSIATAAMMTSLFPLGGVIGNLCTGWLMDRIDGNRVISSAWLLSAAMMLLVGFGLIADIGNTVTLGFLTVLMGCVVTAGTSAMSAYAATIYPTEGRATGVAWMLGIGRIGGVVGAFGGGTILGLGLSFGGVVSLLAIPAVIAFISLRVIAYRVRQAHKGLERNPSSSSLRKPAQATA